MIGRVVLGLLFATPMAFGQISDFSSESIAFKPVPGTPSESTVTAMVQDYQGFMWIGTRNGLNRYDGLKFVIYEHVHAEPGSLSDGYVSCLYEDRRRNLWVGTWAGGLNRYDRAGDTFTHLTHDPDDATTLSHPRVHAIFEDDRGRLWVGTENGLNLYHPETNSFTRFFHDPADPHSLAHNEVRRILADGRGNLWIGTYGGGLDRFIPSSQRFEHHSSKASDPNSLSSDYVRSAFLDTDGELWIGTRRGLNRLTGEGPYRFQRYLHDPATANSLPHNRVIALSEDDFGRLWIGTENGGLSLLDKDRGTFTNFLHNPLDQASIQSNSIWSLYKDNVGTMWLGAYNSELETWNRFQTKFRHHQVMPRGTSLSNNNVTCFVEDYRGNLWIGTDGGGVNYYDRATSTYTNYRHDPGEARSLGSDAVVSLMEDADRNIWIGTYDGGLNRFDPTSGTFIRFQHDPDDPTSIGSNNVFSMLIDQQGRFWVGAFFAGLDLFDPATGTFRHFNTKAAGSDDLSDHRVFKILEDQRGNLWIGTQGGGLNLLQWDDTGEARFIRYRHEPGDSTSLGGDIILSMLEAQDGTLWIGTYGEGLSRFDHVTNTFKTYRKPDGLGNQVINGILEDEQGRLWLSTNNGLSRFDPQRETFKNYDVWDGLQGKEFIRGSCYKTSKGELLFGGLNGYNAFLPREVSENPYLPPVYLTDFRVFNESVRPGAGSPLPVNITEAEAIVLAHDQNVFSFEIAALNYTQSGKNQYAYQLEGYDKNWQYTGTRRNAYYTQVPPGRYTFRAKAANNNDLWNEEGVSLRVIITPPWYKTWWAYTLYGLAVLALFYWYRSNLIRRERLKSELRLEHLELEKMVEMDRIKSNFFANMAHEFRTPLALIRGPLQALYENRFRGEPKRQFRIMLRNTEKLLSLINQLLDLSKLGVGGMRLEVAEGDMIRFLKPVIASFHSYAKIQHIKLSFHHPSEPVRVFFDGDKLEQIMNNLLSNAFKFTPEYGAVTVNLAVVPREEADRPCVEIEVKDTGIGIPEELLPNIFNRFYQVSQQEAHAHRGSGIGLSLTKELVELHQGTIAVSSQVNLGSSFRVRLPLGKDHLNEADIVPPPSPPNPEAPAASMVEEDESVRGQLPAPTPDHHLPLVLIVEDDEDFRAYIAEHLETNYRLEEARNGREGLEIALDVLPDLIISDVAMDEMDGLEMCRRIKTDERTSHIPVLLLTGRSSAQDEIAGFEEGADYYIVKPFNAKLLELRVRNIIRSRELFQKQLAENKGFNLEPQQIELIPADKRFLETALAAIEQNMDNSEFTVEAFGRELGLSRMQLYRKLKALTEQSPNDFIRTIRLKRAAQLLEQNQLTIAEVTYSVGFTDLQYFRECFRKQFGVTPSKYRG